MKLESKLTYDIDNLKMQWEKHAYLVSIILALFILGLLAGCNTSASVVTTAVGANSTTPAVLEPGQSADFPGYVLTLHRVVWNGDTLDAYWIVQNNGTKNISWSQFMLPGFSVTDDQGDTEGTGTDSPQWDDLEKSLPILASPMLKTSNWPLRPGQQGVYFRSSQLGPLPKGVQTTYSYLFESKSSHAVWNMGR